MRAMLIPTGQHSVEFRFEPKSLKTGKTISLIGSFLILLLVIGTAWQEFRPTRVKTEK
jgi:uncharacterized membrane protein YfhO